MRHQKKRGRISRNISHRKAMLKNMANSLFKYQRLETTMAKAKALRCFAEPLITAAKKDPGSLVARRQVFRKLCDRDAVRMLFAELGPLYKDVPGGYTRIMPLGNRRGDGARMVIMELTRRTIPDEELLGVSGGPKKPLKEEIKAKKKGEAEAKEGKEQKHAAPELKIEEKEERSVEDVRKEKAKTEQKKMTRKGLFRVFRRKSMG
ncbi:MAG: 50S ribosomal protein L17 [Candidatus Omnitrophica bacterium]|nr:50S ribosomal protein L17 [Candidatus Omnitrophota bacterium]